MAEAAADDVQHLVERAADDKQDVLGVERLAFHLAAALVLERGLQLEGATAAFNEAVGSYERMVRPSGERLVKLTAGASGKELVELEPVDTALRLPHNGTEATEK